jgi:hypothetical protein
LHLAASIIVILAGLYLGLVADTVGEMRVFGWALAAVGVVGLVSRWFIARATDRRDPRGGRR